MFKRKNKPTLSTKVSNFFWPKAGLKRSTLYIWHRIARISGSPHYIAMGIAAGAMVSWTPFIGFHFLLAAIVAFFIRGSLIASAFGTFFGNPFTFPFIWIATYNLGGFILGMEHKSSIDISLPHGTFALLLTDPSRFGEVIWEVIGPYLIPMLIGSIPLGLICFISLYFLMRTLIASYQQRRRNRLARARDNNTIHQS